MLYLERQSHTLSSLHVDPKKITLEILLGFQVFASIFLSCKSHHIELPFLVHKKNVSLYATCSTKE